MYKRKTNVKKDVQITIRTKRVFTSLNSKTIKDS